jgi:hypothetical protein
MDFLINNRITLHAPNKHNKCVWPFSDHGIRLLMELFSNRLASGRVTEETLATMQFVQMGSWQQNRTIPVYSRHVPAVGDMTGRCPCINSEGKECGMTFNFSDPNVRFALQQLLVNVSRVVRPAVNAFFELLHNFMNPPQADYRSNPVCTRCGQKFPNIAGCENANGDNPTVGHPQDATCLHCENRFCTDCGGQHLGTICKGFPPDTMDDMFQACPGCRRATWRESGCPTMTCPCGVIWCWICRCLRHPEQHHDADPINNHYCMTLDRYMANPIWAENRAFEAYRENHPLVPNLDGYQDIYLGRDGREWVPL